MFNNKIAKTEFGESEVDLFFCNCEINKAKEIRANNTAISTSKILIATEFDGVLKFTSLSNSVFLGNISGRLKVWSPFDSSSVKLYCTKASKLW